MSVPLNPDLTGPAFRPTAKPGNVSFLLLTDLSRAPPPPQIIHDDSLHASLVDVDSPHISSVSSDYHGETKTQVERLEREAEDEERAAKAKFEEVAEKASKNYKKGKEATAKKAKEAKAAAKDAGTELRVNRDNPVVVANALLVGLGAVGLRSVKSLITGLMVC